MAASAYLNQVQQIYIAYYGRPADPLGQQYWANQLDKANGDLTQIINAFGTSAEATALYGNLTQAQSVNTLYQQLFNRPADVDGLKFYVNGLQTGAFTLASIALNIFNGAVGDDKTALGNKVTVANSFTAALDTTAEITGYAGTVAATSARTFLATVTKDAATVTTATAGLDAAVLSTTTAGTSAAVVGQTFTLTDKAGENIVGTANNDTFSAVLSNTAVPAYDAANSTLNLGDIIDGAAGTDTLNLILSGGKAGTPLATPAGVTIKNVEIVNLVHTDDLGATTASVLANSATYTGIQQLWQTDNSAAAGTFGNVVVGDGVTAGFRSTNDFNTAVATAVGTTVTTAATSQKAVTVALDGVGSGSAITAAAPVGGKIETVTVSGTVAKANATTDGTLTVNGTADTLTENVSLSSNATVALGAAAKLATVDFSGSTGGITADLKAFTVLTSVKGGSGNDSLTLNLETGKALAVDTGAGNDTVTLNNNGTAAATNKVTTLALGAGKDTLTFVTANIGNVADATAANVANSLITVTDFKTSEDVLNLAGTGQALTAAQLTVAAGKADLAAAAGYVESVLFAGGVGTKTAAVFNFGGDAYVVVDHGGVGGAADGTFNATDGLIKLVGVDAAQFSNVQNGNLVL